MLHINSGGNKGTIAAFIAANNLAFQMLIVTGSLADLVSSPTTVSTFKTFSARQIVVRNRLVRNRIDFPRLVGVVFF